MHHSPDFHRQTPKLNPCRPVRWRFTPATGAMTKINYRQSCTDGETRMDKNRKEGTTHEIKGAVKELVDVIGV